ncbi:methylmalonyl-CoA mutase family protein [Enterovirga rhinocerotis]|uniref:Methylmalonyl-CoA mutase n=1 Tax=Enterovirga rhinocerotis TaxID=1339210 RepID=A0A4R7C8V1_9HYPH|nr:methylmalonyl-CoA mutase family protein [Enterovirga rhinocerotis]TDR94821.1 methylmalonyl-CoA mutase [Enterovirga rhinocerotis]
MSEQAADLPLASEFPAPTQEAWRAAAEKALKGRDFDKVLVGRSYDGIRIDPLYAKAEDTQPVAGRAATPWRIIARVDHPDPSVANALVRADLEGGADALVIAATGSRSARGFGLAISPESLATTLDGVMLDLIALRLDPGPDAAAAVEAVHDLARARGHDLATLDLDLGLDPIGAAAGSGELDDAWSAALSDRFGRVAKAGFSGRFARADGRPYHEAGASEAQELACVLATGVAYLRALEAGGHDLEAARGALSFLLVADADEFLTVAKFRAFRRLWAAIESSCGLAPKPVQLAAETAWRMTTRRDPWVNLLRTTLATFSAGIGGADGVSVLPFTAALGLPDAFARRLARNTQLVLLEESNLWRAADPVAGSGTFETLTDDLVREGWKRFREIESEGGIAASLASGALAGRLAETRGKREAAIAVRRDPITGTSEFPDLRETPVAVLIEAPAAPAATNGGPLPSRRDAELYEVLRDRSDARLAATGRRPSVFLANLGTPAAFTARTTFARNAFEAVGIEALTNDGFADREALVAAFRASGSEIACLCSSDDIYAQEAEAVANALRQAGARHIAIAGRPGEHEAAWRAAGIETFVSVGTNLPGVLGGLV